MASYSDTFTQSNGTALTTFGWSTMSGTGAEVQSNEATCITFNDTVLMRYSSAMATDEYSVECDVGSITGTGSAYAGPMACGASAAATGVYMRASLQFGNYNCESILNGSYNGGSVISTTPAAGHRMKIEQVDNAGTFEWRFYLDTGSGYPGTPNVTIANTGWSSPLTITRNAGIYLRRGPSDEIRADDWNADDLSASSRALPLIGGGLLVADFGGRLLVAD